MFASFPPIRSFSAHFFLQLANLFNGFVVVIVIPREIVSKRFSQLANFITDLFRRLLTS